MTTPYNHTPELYQEVTDFLVYEAELLDSGRFREWFELLTEDIVYQMPVRVTRERRAGAEFSSEAWHLNETWDSLRTRVARLETDSAWAENPPSRTRRFITNIRIRPGHRADELNVVSNILPYRNQADSVHLLSAERHDVWRRVHDQWRLSRRLILLDQSTLGTHNLAIFL